MIITSNLYSCCVFQCCFYQVSVAVFWLGTGFGNFWGVLGGYCQRKFKLHL